MTRPRGGYIGFNRVPAAAALNSAASGVWTLREAEALRRAGTWPSAFVNPTSLTGLQLWLDAADSATLFDATSGGALVAADGGVKRWEDKSGNARHATQSTDANRPTRKTSVQGGKDVLRFDGSNDRMSIGSSTATFKFLHSTDSTVFLVGKPGTTANPNALYVFLDNNARSTSAGFSFWYDDRASQSRNDRPVPQLSNGSGTVSIGRVDDKFLPNVFSLISIVSTPAAAMASRLTLRTNGGASYGGNDENATLSTADATADLFIGSNKDAGEFLNGDIAEIIIYDSALSDTDREAVRDYLIAKWGIT